MLDKLLFYHHGFPKDRNFIKSSYSEEQFREKRMQSLLMQIEFLAVHVYSTLNLWELQGKM